VGGEPQLYHLDAIRVGDILSADVSARNEGQYELCGGDYGRRRPPGHVRSAHLPLPHVLFLCPAI